MATKQAAYTESVSHESPVAVLSLRVVRTEEVPLYGTSDGVTFGTVVDRLLVEAAQRSDEVQSFTIDILPKQWAAFADSIRA